MASDYGRKPRAPKIEWPELVLALSVIALSAAVAATFISALMYWGNWLLN
jgi:hypothetical protein